MTAKKAPRPRRSVVEHLIRIVVSGPEAPAARGPGETNSEPQTRLQRAIRAAPHASLPVAIAAAATAVVSILVPHETSVRIPPTAAAPTPAQVAAASADDEKWDTYYRGLRTYYDWLDRHYRLLLAHQRDTHPAPPIPQVPAE